MLLCEGRWWREVDAQLRWTYLIKTGEADTCICLQAHINTATSSNTSHPRMHTYCLFFSVLQVSLCNMCLRVNSLANHLCFQGHSFSSWPRCYGNFQPPTPPSPWTKDKQYISVSSISRPRYSFTFRNYCFSSRIQTERSFDLMKKKKRMAEQMWGHSPAILWIEPRCLCQSGSDWSRLPKYSRRWRFPVRHSVLFVQHFDDIQFLL